MIEKDIERYASANWGELMKTVTELSTGGKDRKPLVENERKFYHFDQICKMLSGEKTDLPTSADGMSITAKKVCLIEFKSGFVQKITKNNYDKKKMTCKKTKEECADYRDLFFKHKETEREELLSSLRQKAVESYLLLEKQILPRCPEGGKRLLNYLVVIDDDPVNEEEDILADMAGVGVDDNRVTAIRSSLRRLVGRLDADGNIYCYDKIEVHTAANFNRMLDLWP